MKKTHNKAPITVTLITVFMALSTWGVSQEKTTKSVNLDHNYTTDVMNDYIKAINSGNREQLETFISKHFHKKFVSRLPLFVYTSFNLKFYYESGGLGYELKKINPKEAKQISAQVINKLTGAWLTVTMPIVAGEKIAITNFPKFKATIPPKGAQKLEKLKDHEIVEKLEIALKKLKSDDEFSGAILLAKNGKPFFNEVTGLANKSYPTPINNNTKFNIASVGKIFTAVAIIQLVEKGKLNYEDPLNKYLPEGWLDPEISKKIQIRHLLTHTSGLGDYFRDAYKQTDLKAYRNISDYKKVIADDILLFEPGTKWQYSNTGFMLLGVVIEQVSGEKYFNYLQKNIFTPLGMNNTIALEKDHVAENRTTGYIKAYNGKEVIWMNNHSSRIIKGSPSGGIYSSTHDLLKFDNALRSNKILSAKSSELLYKTFPEINSTFHSYAFFISNGDAGLVASHSGDGNGICSQYKMYIDKGYTVIVLSNYNRPATDIIESITNQLITYRSGKD